MSKQITLIPELNDSAAFMMGLAYKQFRTIANQMLTAEFDVTLEMVGALRVLHHLGRVPQQSLSTALHRERSVTKRMVDNCIKRGLIEVHKSDTNKKARYLVITTKGINTKNSADDQLRSIAADFYSPLSEEERELLLSLCKKLVQDDIILGSD
jgi:DNA-binding MarR family transcriptional regulator